MKWRPRKPSTPPPETGPIAARRRRDLLVLAAGASGLALLVQQADHLAAGAYRRARPGIERQLSRVLGHPLELGDYQGISPQGLRVGPSRLQPVAGDASNVSVSGLTVGIDPLASLRQRLPVLGLGLQGGTVDLRRRPGGGFWALGRLPPGRPPRLELRIQVLTPARVTLSGLPAAATALRFDAQGRAVLRLHQQAIEAQAQARLPGQATQLDFDGQGNWQQRRWRGTFRSAALPLTILKPWLGRIGRFDGRARGRVTLDWSPRQLDCRGDLRLQQVRWQAPGGGQTIALGQAPMSCRGERLELAASSWRSGPWRGTVAAAGTVASGFDLQVRAGLPGTGGGRQPLALAGQGRWQAGLLTVRRLEARYGRSRLLASGQVGRRLELSGRWLLAATDLPLRQPLPPWLLGNGLEGDLWLQGKPAAPELRLSTGQGRHGLIGAWQAAVSWRAGILRLDGLRSPHLWASASLPLKPAGGRLRVGPLEGRIDLRQLPLTRLAPLLESRLDGSLDARGSLRGPLGDLQPDLTLILRRPRVGSLRLDEDWSGRLLAAGGNRQLAMVSLRGQPGRLRAQLDRRWQPVLIRLERSGGLLELAGRPSGYRWQASALPLGGLSLALGPRSTWRPLEGWLGGAGVLDLQPLAFSGRITLTDPVVLSIGARQLQADVDYNDRDYTIDATATTLAAGSLRARAQGRWQGPFDARLEGRGLTPLLARQLSAAWQVWQGREPPTLGSAGDLGGMGTDSLLFSIDQHLRLLQEAIALRRRQGQAALAEGPAGRLSRLQARVDADLRLHGPSLAEARAELEARGHLWLDYDDRDHRLAGDPFSLRLEGPLRGRGSFTLEGLPLVLLALLTPVPEGLRGQLAVRGRYDLSGRAPRLGMDLELAGAGVGPTGLALERGRLDLADRTLSVDLAALAEGSSDPVEMVGTIPLEAQRPDLELRVSSRGNGLRFLTNLAGQALVWQQGGADLQLLVRGSLAAPIANGFLRLSAGQCRFIGQDLRDIEATVLFDFEQLVVQRLSARVGAKGQLNGSGSLGLLRPQPSGSGLQLRVGQVPFNFPPRIRAVADGTLVVDGSVRAPRLGGRLAIRNGVINAQPAPLATARPASDQAARPVSMNELLEQGWTFQEPLVLLGPDVDSEAAEALRQAVPKVPWLSFNSLQLDLGPDLRVTVPRLANFLTGGSVRLGGRLDPSLTASGVVRLRQGRLNLFTTTFSLDPDAPNVAVFTPSTGLVPYLDIALRTRISDSLSISGPGRIGTVGSAYQPTLQEIEASGGINPLNRLNLVLVTVSVSGPADRLAENIRLRSNPPLPQERLIALIGGNTMASLSGGAAGAALATVLGQSLLSPLLGTLSDAFGSRVSFALYPTYVNQALVTGRQSDQQGLPPQLVLGAEVGIDITDRFNAAVLAAPNQSDIPPQITLTYKASELFSLQGSVDTQGSWQTQLQVFFRF